VVAGTVAPIITCNKRGTNCSSTSEDFGLARYNADGSIDTSFGNEGVVITDIEGSDGISNVDRLRDLIIQADGQIIVSGMSAADEYSDYDWALARHHQ
jgi:hypothetical protein